MLNFLRKLLAFICINIIFLFCSSTALALTEIEKNTAQYFNQIKNDPQQLYMFLHEMPKGGDLHNHISGATYAEHLIREGAADQFCINKDTFSAVSNDPTCRPENTLAKVADQPDFYSAIINHWSMRHFVAGKQSTQDHFFAIFVKIGSLLGKQIAPVVAEIVSRAGEQHENYLELLITPYDLNLFGPNGDSASSLTTSLIWDGNFATYRDKLLKAGLPNVVNQISERLNALETNMRSQLHCNSNKADPGCPVTVRYQYLGLRESSPERLFAQLVAGFEAAQKDPRIVGINIVQLESGPIATRDYDLHMSMLNYLHQVYPRVHISLHAGELALKDVSPEDLRFHIRHAIEMGQAERIGHGTAIAYEQHADQLLKEMAARHILVEVNLTSNATLLGVRGKYHPLPLYLHYHVPVALSTDDEGILRTHLTREYQRAVLDYHLDYLTLKMMARNSIQYSFLPGQSLWQHFNYINPVAACQQDSLGNKNPSQLCQQFLAHNEKARIQWDLEKQFNEFERQSIVGATGGRPS